MTDTTNLADLIHREDTLRFKLFAQKVIVQQDARLMVEVQALVSTADRDSEQLERRIRDALNRFIVAEWSFSSIRRAGDAVGFERVALYAATRIPVSEIFNLEERARQASSEGLSLKDPKINYSVPAQRVSEAVDQLRREIVEDAKQQILSYNALTGRQWRIGDISFGIEDKRGEFRTGKGAYRNSDEEIADLLGTLEDDPRMTSAERITLVADVTLKSKV